MTHGSSSCYGINQSKQNTQTSMKWTKFETVFSAIVFILFHLCIERALVWYIYRWKQHYAFHPSQGLKKIRARFENKWWKIKTLNLLVNWIYNIFTCDTASFFKEFQRYENTLLWNIKLAIIRYKFNTALKMNHLLNFIATL